MERERAPECGVSMAQNQWLSHHTLPFWCHPIYKSEYRTFCFLGSQALALARSASVFKGISGHLLKESPSTSERCPSISPLFCSQLITSFSGGKAVQGITFQSRVQQCQSQAAGCSAHCVLLQRPSASSASVPHVSCFCSISTPKS